MKKKLAVLTLAAFLIVGCGEVPKLKNGQDAVVTFENGDMISVDELYENIKKDFGLSSLVTMIDTYVLENNFKDYKDTATKQAESYLEAMTESYGIDTLTLAQQYGFSNEEALKNYLYLNYMQQHAVEEYAKTQVSDDEIEKYYKDEVVGDIEVSHILITPVTTDSMTDEEVKNAEKTAEDKAKSILKELKSAKNLDEAFKEAAEKNSEDEATAKDGGSLGKINKATLSSSYKELVDAAYKTKDGALYGSVVKTKLGYHVIYRTKSYDKKELKDVKSDIVNTLSQQLMSTDSTIYMKALTYYRDKAGLKITDDDLNTQYSNYVQNGLTPKTSQN